MTPAEEAHVIALWQQGAVLGFDSPEENGRHA
jgi:hypothetical protein